MKKIEEKEIRETGIVFALVLILIGLVENSTFYYQAAVAILVAVLIVPVVFRPLAWAWFGLAYFLGRISSAIILTVSYLTILLPVALLLKLSRKDSLKLRKFKKDVHSVFNHRGHRYTQQDISKPY